MAQPGNANYLPALAVDRSFAVSKADQTITFIWLADKTLGDLPFMLNASASSGLPVSFAVQTPAICSVNGNTGTLVGVGVCTIAATQDGNAAYNAAPAVTQSFTVDLVNQLRQKIFLPLVKR